MDLDDLKYQLKDKLATAHEGLADQDLAALLRRHTVSITDKLKRNLWIEIICCAAAIIGFAAVALFSAHHSFRIYFSVFAILCVVFLVVLLYLLRRTKKLSNTARPVKTNLTSLVKLIEEFSRCSFQFTMALLPICFLFALLIGYNDRQPMPLLGRFAPNPLQAKWIIFALIAVYLGAMFMGLYYFTSWYLRKQFGRYVAQLKACISELDE